MSPRPGKGEVSFWKGSGVFSPPVSLETARVCNGEVRPLQEEYGDGIGGEAGTGSGAEEGVGSRGT